MVKIKVYDRGLLVQKEKGIKAFNGGSVEKRGRIVGFSSSARRRLREVMLTSYCPTASNLVGITLTLPWVDYGSDVMEDFKAVNQRFQVYWLRRFGRSCAAVYRVELQVRGVPHLHLMAWHDDISDLSAVYFDLWYKALLGDLRGGLYGDFARFGVRVDTAVNYDGVVRYLAEHTSKAKQAQLGYRGKQWGILGRHNLRRYDGLSLDLTEWEMVRLLRVLRKITRFRVKCPCVFGSRLRGGRGVSCRVSFLRGDTVRRYVAWLALNCDDNQG